MEIPVAVFCWSHVYIGLVDASELDGWREDWEAMGSPSVIPSMEGIGEGRHWCIQCRPRDWKTEWEEYEDSVFLGPYTDAETPARLEQLVQLLKGQGKVVQTYEEYERENA